MKYSLSSKKAIRSKASYNINKSSEQKHFTWWLLAGCIVVVAILAFPKVDTVPTSYVPHNHVTTTGKLSTPSLNDQKAVSAIATAHTTHSTSTLVFSHRAIMTTEFWVGEPPDSDNGSISNTSSTWDGQWQQHYGGVDSPAPRVGFLPAAFTPHENSFYVALPYSDADGHGKRRTSAAHCLDVSGNSASAYSWCKNTWLAINFNGKTVFAQWEDAGPFGENDVAYVFGSAEPSNTTGEAAGLDVSPAVTTYLGLSGADLTDWSFVNSRDVPDGPWKQTLTTTSGETID